MKVDVISRLLVSVFVVFLLDCGIAGKGPSGKRPGLEGEDLDPFDYSDEFGRVARSVRDLDVTSEGGTVPEDVSGGTGDRSGGGEGGEAVPGTGRPDGGVEAKVYGYRIQIGIDEDKDRMERLAERARTETDLRVYLEYEAPFYRVRVGNFRTRHEAEQYIRILKAKGFKDSLWVMSEIEVD